MTRNEWAVFILTVIAVIVLYIILLTKGII